MQKHYRESIRNRARDRRNILKKHYLSSVVLPAGSVEEACAIGKSVAKMAA